MIDANFSLTSSLLDKLVPYDKYAGKLNSLVVVHICGGVATAGAAMIDTFLHLVACVIKVAIGIIATPVAYFTNSRTAKNWAWSTAGKHFLQAIHHAVGIILAPTSTFFFSPKAAQELLFSEKDKMKNQRKQHQRQIDSLQAAIDSKDRQLSSKSRQLSSELSTQRSLQQEINRQRDQLFIQNTTMLSLQNQLTAEQRTKNDFLRQMQQNNSSEEIIALRNSHREANAQVSTLKAQLSVHRQNQSENESNLKDLRSQLRAVESNVAALKSQLSTKDAEISSLRQDINRLQQSLSQESNKVALTKRSLSECRQDLVEKDKVIAELKEKLKATTNAIPSTLVKAIDELAAEVVCSIDYELLTTGVCVSPCGHKFNRKGVEDLLGKQAMAPCPECREPIKEYHDDHKIRSIAHKIDALSSTLQGMGIQLSSL